MRILKEGNRQPSLKIAMTAFSPSEKTSSREGTSSRAVGEKVGRYEIIRLLGRGSMGAVYLASDPLIGREVALKTLSSAFSVGKDEIERLRRHYLNEARSAGGLRHPGIVTIYDVIEERSGRISIAMEHVKGPTLRERLRDPEPLALEAVAEIVSQIGEVLDYAHSQGVIHRDIKPANIVLASDGQAKVTDFGIAALRGSDLGRELGTLGTPNYLAPERFLDLEVDYRSDIYSLGVVLYELLTRHLPFQGETIGELASNIAQEEFTPPEIHRPDLPRELRELFYEALAKEPSDRFQSAGELAARVRSVVEEQAKLNDTVATPTVEEGEIVSPSSEAETLPRLADAPSKLNAGVGRVHFSSLVRFLTRPLTPVRTAFLTVAAVFGLLGLLSLSGRGQTVPGIHELSPASPEQMRQSEYRALLVKSEKLLANGDFEAAERIARLAEGLSPEAVHLRRIRDKAEQRRKDRWEAERQAEIRANFEEAQAAFERRDLGATETALASLLEIDPDHEAGLVLVTAVRGVRESLLRPAPPIETPVDLPVVVEEPKEEEPPPAAAFEAFNPVAETTLPIVDAFGTVRIDFQSLVPRGVLTLYSGQDQILRRSFRFVEKRGFLRRKGVSGGFDSQVRLQAGDHELRAYLVIPGQETQSDTLTGNLAPGGIRTLRVRVSATGRLEMEFY